MSELCHNCFKQIEQGNICPFCGYDNSQNSEAYPFALKPGTILNGRYIIGRVLGQGGYGITYACLDHNTGERLAIKEYLPSEYAERIKDTNALRITSDEYNDAYNYGKDMFLSEAKTLANLMGIDNVVEISSYFEENNTAYFAMEYVEGTNLVQYMTDHGGRLTPIDANTLLFPVMDALSWVHSKGIIHRDIAPDNIIITPDGVAKLIDFGAARYSMGEKTHSFDVILKDGFAPVEQYTRRGRQGPFTDVYAMSATYYYTITGKIPPDAINRTSVDELKSPSQYGAQISNSMEDALRKGLAPYAKNRFTSMEELRSALQSAMQGEIQVIPQDGLQEQDAPAQDQESLDNIHSSGAVMKTNGAMGRDITFTQQENAPEEVIHGTASSDEKKGKVKKLLLIVSSAIIAGIAVFFIVSSKTKDFASESTNLPAETINSSSVNTSNDNKIESLEEIVAGAEQGDASYLYRLGKLYFDGIDPEEYRYQKILLPYNQQNIKTAKEYFQKSAEKGCAEGMQMLGEVCLDCMEYEDALYWSEKAAELGNAEAMGTLGYMYRVGDGIDRDVKTAQEWYSKYLNQLEMIPNEDRTPDNLIALGNLYYYGRGVSKDPIKAAEYYSAAVSLLEMYATEFNNLYACDELGSIYSSDDYCPTVETDEIKSLEWYLKAADAGDASSQYSVACEYLFSAYNNGGLFMDEDLGLEYLAKSAENGYLYAFQTLSSNNYFAKLSEDQQENLFNVCEIYEKDGSPSILSCLASFYSANNCRGKNENLAKEYEQKAIDIYKSAYEDRIFVYIDEPVYTDVCIALGDIYRSTVTSLNNTDEAVSWYSKAFEGNSPTPVYATYMLYLTLYQEDTEGALSWLKKGLQYVLDNESYGDEERTLYYIESMLSYSSTQNEQLRQEVLNLINEIRTKIEQDE